MSKLFVVVFVAVLSVSFSLSGAAADSPTGVSGSAQVASNHGRLFLPALAADAPAAPRTCDPAHPRAGDLSFRELHHATVSGGQVYTGIVVNHCSSPVDTITLAASFWGSNRKMLDAEVAATVFPTLAPGGASPFQFIVESGRSVAAVRLRVRSYHVASNAADLRVSQTRTSATDALVTVDFTLTNAGPAPAVRPKVAARLVGAGCADPYVVAAMNGANELAPGQTYNGEISLPRSCTAGLPELLAGGSASTQFARGLTFRSAILVYDAGGVAHLFADVCNGDDGDYLFPLFHIRLNGPSGGANVDIYNTGYFPAGGCSALSVALAGTAPGLSFAGLTSFEGQRAEGVERVEFGLPDPILPFDDPFDPWDIPDLPLPLPDLPLPDPFEDLPPIPDIPDLPPVPDDPFDVPFDPPPDLPPFSPDDFPVPSIFNPGETGYLTAADQPPTVSKVVIRVLIYNDGGVDLVPGGYRPSILVHGADGSVIGGLDLANITVPAHSWKLVSVPIASLLLAPGAQPRFPAIVVIQPPY